MAHIYSHSQVQLYTSCPRQYQYRYIDKLPKPAEQNSIHMQLGTIVHDTLEELYRAVSQTRGYTEQELVDIYTKKRDTLEEWSLYIPDSDEYQTFVMRGERYVREYRHKYAPFEQARVISLEQSMTFDLTDTIRFRVKLDRLDKIGDMWRVIDYKTWTKLPTMDDETYIDQIYLYGLGVMAKYGVHISKLQGILQFLHHDIEYVVDITEEWLEKTRQKYIDLITEIEDKRFRYHMWEVDIFGPEESRACNWCAFRQVCPLFAHSYAQDEVISMISDESIYQLVDRYTALKSQAADIDKQTKSIRSTLVAYIKHKEALGEDIWALYSDTSALGISKSINYKIWDEPQLRDILPADIVADLLKIDRHALARHIKDGQIRYGDISTVVEKSDSYTLRKKKFKK